VTATNGQFYVSVTLMIFDKLSKAVESKSSCSYDYTALTDETVCRARV